MASEKVLQSLETLHRELDKLSPAIEHVQTAQKISETVKDIPNKHLELIKSIKQTDEDYKKELKEQLKSDASKITVEVNQIIQKFKDTQDLLKGEIIDLEADLKAYIFEAIEVEKAGLKIEYKKTEDFEMTLFMAF